MVENIRTIQDHIRFLESYINEITTKIDEITGGREIEKEILSIEYRIEVLKRGNGLFEDRVAELQKEVKKIRDEYAKVKPVVDKLEEERAFYRQAQTDLSLRG